MTPSYRNDQLAALERANALEAEIEELRALRAHDESTIEILRRHLALERRRVAKLGTVLADVRHRRLRGLPSNAGTVLALACVSLFVFQPLGLLTWLLANKELRAIDSGHADPHGRGVVVTSRVIGVCTTLLFMFWAWLVVMNLFVR